MGCPIAPRKLGGLGCALFLGLVGCQLTPLEPPQDTELRLGFRGVPFQKKVKSWRDRRFENVVPQRVDYSCGAAALATLLRYFYAEPVNEEEVTYEMLQAGDRDRIRREGFSLLDMKRYAEQRNYESRGFAIAPHVLERLAIPAITVVNTRGYSHFAVLKGARDGMVYLADPALGNRAMRKKEFLEEWSGTVFFVAAERDDSLPSPLQQLEANLRGPRGDVRYLDFPGIRRLVFDASEF